MPGTESMAVTDIGHGLEGRRLVAFEIAEDGDEPSIRIIGELAGSISPETRERIWRLCHTKRSLTLDFSHTIGFSGTGLRKLLQFCRQVLASGGVFEAIGVSADLKAHVDAAGFGDLLRARSPAKQLAMTSVSPLTLAPRVDVYPTHQVGQFALRIGTPLPLGAYLVAGGVNFSLFSGHATACTLVLFESGAREPVAEIPFPKEFRVGDIFCMTVFGLDPESFEYGFRLDGPFSPELGHRFDRSKILLDPTARSVVTPKPVRETTEQFPLSKYRSRLIPEDFDWQGDQPPQLPIEDLVIYEAHVRGFTRSPSSGVKFPGTYAGIREKIPYLKELGINCLELLPIFQFQESEANRLNPATSEPYANYWGYNTIAFHAPHAGYSATAEMGTEADELKALVKELHRNGIEIMLDVVFNHTAEGDERGPTISFRGIDNRNYYMLTPDGNYLNFSGCGNTVNCNHPVVRDFVLNCLRYWVSEYHIDGFRFDLASILGRATDGSPLANPPLLEALAMDPVLGSTKLIAEAWDAGGLYQVGSFPAYGRWAEWNGQFRDCLRRALKSDEGQMPELAQRLMGSPDLYATRGPTASVNFITCHDGFTLADLVSYDIKHNEANGENNRDGANDNQSWNCGVEGPTDDPRIVGLRRRQMKNALTLLFLSQGVPMLLMGDEVGRTQHGNNNTYCHDSPLNWLDWSLQSTNDELFRFCKGLTAFRRNHSVLRGQQHARSHGDHGEEIGVTWHGTQLGNPDWMGHSRTLALTLEKVCGDHCEAIYLAINFYWEPLEFRLPEPPDDSAWHIFVNTGATTPADLFDEGAEAPVVNTSNMTLLERSIVVLVAS